MHCRSLAPAPGSGIVSEGSGHHGVWSVFIGANRGKGVGCGVGDKSFLGRAWEPSFKPTVPAQCLGTDLPRVGKGNNTEGKVSTRFLSGPPTLANRQWNWGWGQGRQGRGKVPISKLGGGCRQIHLVGQVTKCLGPGQGVRGKVVIWKGKNTQAGEAVPVHSQGQ